MLLTEQMFRTKHDLHAHDTSCIKIAPDEQFLWPNVDPAQMRPFAFAMILSLAGCTQFPELDSALSTGAQDADYPDLVPVQGLLAQTEPRNGTPEDTVNTLNARLANLRNRADRLRGTVVDASTRRRMQNGVDGT
ncbi:hypothetical protein [Pseudosulfitobacter sp. SM2401]|uniref:hypothetical protein n=1 Tax=Pseudosulfitobacter sp. SM2401 TaxID=3350098 RepID=UPI0036F2113A